MTRNSRITDGASFLSTWCASARVNLTSTNRLSLCFQPATRSVYFVSPFWPKLVDIFTYFEAEFDRYEKRNAHAIRLSNLKAVLNAIFKAQMTSIREGGLMTFERVPNTDRLFKDFLFQRQWDSGNNRWGDQFISKSNSAARVLYNLPENPHQGQTYSVDLPAFTLVDGGPDDELNNTSIRFTSRNVIHCPIHLQCAGMPEDYFSTHIPTEYMALMRFDGTGTAAAPQPRQESDSFRTEVPPTSQISHGHVRRARGGGH